MTWAASPARADRITFGASVGQVRSAGGTTTSPPIETRGLFGRLRLGAGLSVELEVSGLSSAVTRCAYCAGGNGGTGRAALASLRLDLGGRGLVPYAVAGVGTETWNDGSHARREAGGGLDLAVTGGLHLAGELRVGEYFNQPIYDAQVYAPVASDRYLAGRITLGASF